MSKAYLNLKNFNFREMMNLVCYGTKFPDTLTQTQRITRLYRACLRKQNIRELEGLQGNIIKHYDQVHRMSSDFYKIMRINQNFVFATNEEQVEFINLVQKWENWQEQVYEAQGYVEEVRPYSSTSSRYLIFSDQQLNFDPFGFYKPRLVSDNRPIEQLPFFEDYPMNDSSWILTENLPQDFNDSNREEQALKKQN